MTPTRKYKLKIILFFLTVGASVVILILYALRQNINLFYTPEQLIQGKAPYNHMIRVGGMVVEKSIKRSHDLAVEFKLTDFKQTVVIAYNGILPDLFREGQGVVARGKLRDNSHFTAVEVLAKHDANYMPPEVKMALQSRPSL